VNLIVQPDDGVTPIVTAIRDARKTIDMVIFRFDRPEIEKALQAAVAKGVVVRTAIAATNRGGEKKLRKLELRLLAAGVLVSRTAEDLQRYHGKMIVVDDTLHVFGFNFTKLDIERSRSFGVVTRNKALVKAAKALFEADATRQQYKPTSNRLVVSPESSRAILADLLRRARRELLIYDDRITDRLMLRLLQERAKKGVSIRVIGKLADKKIENVEVRKLVDLRMHIRAIVVDGTRAFIGSQSLRKLQLEMRREIGIIIHDSRVAAKIRAVFEADWEQAAPKKEAVKEPEKEAAKDSEGAKAPASEDKTKAADKDAAKAIAS
jgi:phosphatidylserine/phosphatidylglycerophosphate/cardiolipin synthase-like enzyme